MIRDRIRELRRVRAGDLAANPKNWRRHPKAQVDAVQGILREIGYADALLARELPGGTLELIDGHLRQGLDPEQIVPVLILDVSEAEAVKLLVSFDPLAAMAESNAAALEQLLTDVQTNDAGLQAMFDDLALSAGVVPVDDTPLPEIEETTRDTVVVPYDDADVPALKAFLGVDELPPQLGKAISERIKGSVATGKDQQRRRKKTA